jgi:hypothetical protein
LRFSANRKRRRFFSGSGTVFLRLRRNWTGGAEGAAGEVIEIKKDGITEAKLDLK